MAPSRLGLPAAALVLGLVLGLAPEWAGALPSDDSSTNTIERGNETRGRWRPVRPDPVDPALAADIEQLESLGYSAGKRTAGDRVGVTRHQPDRTCPGWNVVNSAHEPGAYLMDMDGAIHWRWGRAYDDIFPDGATAGVRDLRKDMWRRARLLPDGGVIVVFESLGIARLDATSRTVWASAIPAHHDFELLADGSLLVLTREARMGSGRQANRAILEDFVTRLDGTGQETSHVSLLEAVTRSALGLVFEAPMASGGDLFHTNSVRSIDGALVGLLPEFRAGHLLVSMRNIDTIAVIDPTGPAVVWADQGSYRRQHDARLLANGRILLFDNGASESRVLEIDAVSREITWQYAGTPDSPLFSEECGLAQRLPNGNTLVTETDAGRALEVEPGGQVVWEYCNPFRAGPADGLVAAIFEVERIAVEAGGFLASRAPLAVGAPAPAPAPAPAAAVAPGP